MNAITQKKLIEKLAKKLKIKSIEDWKKITLDDVKGESAQIKSLFQEGSIISTIHSIYPQTKSIETNYDWNLLKSQREFLQKFASSKNIKDWSSVTTTEIVDFGGSGLLNCYGGSLFKALKTVFPEHYWDMKSFSRIPREYWLDFENQRFELLEIGKKISINNWKDWYSVIKADIIRHGGTALLNIYDNSHIDAICNILFEYPWDITKFKKEESFWKDMNVQKKFFERLSEKLNIRTYEDWYNVSQQDILKNGGSGLLMKFYGGSPLKALQTIYPQYNWTPKGSIGSELKGQTRLFAVLQNIYPTNEIHANYFHPEIVNSETNRTLELDIFLPELNLAFEYQGKQHSEDLQFFGNFEIQKKNDEVKREACKKLGISLIEVHPTWNGTEESLLELIRKKK